MYQSSERGIGRSTSGSSESSGDESDSSVRARPEAGSGFDGGENQRRHTAGYHHVPGESAFEGPGPGPNVGYRPRYVSDGYAETPGEVKPEGSAMEEAGGLLVDDGRYSDDGYDAYPDEDEGDEGDDKGDGYDC